MANPKRFTRYTRYTCNRRLSGAAPCEITRQACQICCQKLSNLSKSLKICQNNHNISKSVLSICVCELLSVRGTVHRVKCNLWCACPSSSSPQLSVNRQISGVSTCLDMVSKVRLQLSRSAAHFSELRSSVVRSTAAPQSSMTQPAGNTWPTSDFASSYHQINKG